MSDKPFSISTTDNPFSLAAHVSEAAADHFRNEIYDFGRRASSSALTQRDAGSGEGNGQQVRGGLGVEACTPQGEDPAKDPRNPNSPNYNPELGGPYGGPCEGEPQKPEKPGDQGFLCC